MYLANARMVCNFFFGFFFFSIYEVSVQLVKLIFKKYVKTVVDSE